MSEQSEAKSLFERLVWPERTPISDLERNRAAARISRAQAAEKITCQEAEQQRSLLTVARTRGELRAALSGETGLRPANGLALRHAVALLWLLLSGIQLVVWTMICVISGGWADLWWLWTVVIGGAVVGGLWWLGEREYETELARV